MNEEYRKKLIEDNYHSRLNLAAIPDEYMKYSLDGERTYDITDMHGTVIMSKAAAYNIAVQYIVNIAKQKEEGKGIYLYGMPNQKLGMSLLGTFILRAAIDCGYTGLFVPFASLCGDIDYGSFANIDTRDSEKYYDVDFLMIDSISNRGSRSGKICDGITEIILTRRKERKPTIFSSYIDPQTFVDNYGYSVASYLEEFAIKVQIKNDPTDIKMTYKIEQLKEYLDKKQKEYGRDYLTGEEIMDVTKMFLRQGKFMR